MRVASAASNAPGLINIRSIVAASCFQDRIVDFTDKLAQADPVMATIKPNATSFVAIDTNPSTAALLQCGDADAAWRHRGSNYTFV